MHSDSNGDFAKYLISFGIGAIAGAVSQIISNAINGNEFSEGVLGASIGGGIAGL